ncbi:MAG: hypothetical protein IH959_00225 [Chloroflexi bacterium]|nr:hypothetical protein [Chloroflexota bacterium]
MAVRALAGTKKGAFIYTSDEARERWEIAAANSLGHLRGVLTREWRRNVPSCPRSRRP